MSSPVLFVRRGSVKKENLKSTYDSSIFCEVILTCNPLKVYLEVDPAESMRYLAPWRLTPQKVCDTWLPGALIVLWFSSATGGGKEPAVIRSVSP